MASFMLFKCSKMLVPTLNVQHVRILTKNVKINGLGGFRLVSSESKQAFSRQSARRRMMKEVPFVPAGAKSMELGKGLLAGASAVGLGALCYYGLGLSNKSGAIDHMMFWPDYVKQRVRDTYTYFAGSIVITAATAASVFRSPVIMRLVTKNSMMAMAGTMVAMIGSGILVRSLPYEQGFGMKQLAWMLHSSVMGSVIAPVCLMGGPIVLKAAWYTAGIIGGLSMVAICAPSDKFLNMAGPLSIGLGVVLVASLGSMFLPPSTALGIGLHSISLYGGLGLFSLFMLYDTQKIIHRAEHDFHRPYDPINNSISIYIDTINIFVRIVTILFNGGGKRK